MLSKFKDWYEGEYVPFKNDPNSGVFILGGSFKRHWSARLIRVLAEFYLREWKWVIGTTVAVVAVVLKVVS